MANKKEIHTLFLDIGGVLLTNGWDGEARKSAYAHFNLDPKEIEDLHKLNFDSYERDNMPLNDYIRRVYFSKARPFSMDDFKSFMFGQSQALPGMIDFFKNLKSQFHLKIVTISNEGREIMDYRRNHFDLDDFVDIFVVSGYVGYRKPDFNIYRLAVDVSGATFSSSIYIDDRKGFVDVGTEFGFNALQHISLEKTKAALATYFPAALVK